MIINIFFNTGLTHLITGMNTFLDNDKKHLVLITFFNIDN